METKSSTGKIPILAIFTLLAYFPGLVFSKHIIKLSSFTKLPLPPTVNNIESLSFDAHGRGPFTGVSDGRVIRYRPSSNTFVNFATLSSNRSKGLCDGTSNPDLSVTCGRPLGLGFNYITGDLYIADPYFGLLVVGHNGGLATQLATSAEGVPFRFLFGVDVDPHTGIVYFTDASAAYEPRNVTVAIQTGDSTGRLLKYDPRTKKVTVLMRGISAAVSAQVSRDGKFVLVSEFIRKRIHKYWLKGPKANTAEVLLTLPGFVNKIKRTLSGDFWVAVNIRKTDPTLINTPVAYKIKGNGKVLDTIDLSKEYFNKSVGVVQEHFGKLYTGSRVVGFVGEYTIRTI